MDLTNYKRIKKKITESRENCGCCLDCKITPLYSESTGPNLPCAVSVDISCPKKTVSFVKKLSEDHAVKTRQQVLLEIFPDVKMYDGIVSLCPMQIVGNQYRSQCCAKDSCDICKRDYWLSEYEKLKKV